MPYASYLVSCSVVECSSSGHLVLKCPSFRGSACPRIWASAVSFIQCIFALHSGIACLDLCILG